MPLYVGTSVFTASPSRILRTTADVLTTRYISGHFLLRELPTPAELRDRHIPADTVCRFIDINRQKIAVLCRFHLRRNAEISVACNITQTLIMLCTNLQTADIDKKYFTNNGVLSVLINHWMPLLFSAYSLLPSLIFAVRVL